MKLLAVPLSPSLALSRCSNNSSPAILPPGSLLPLALRDRRRLPDSDSSEALDHHDRPFLSPLFSFSSSSSSSSTLSLSLSLYHSLLLFLLPLSFLSFWVSFVITLYSLMLRYISSCSLTPNEVRHSNSAGSQPERLRRLGEVQCPGS